MRQRRRAVSPAERMAASRAVCARLKEMEPTASLIAVYLASPDEIDLSSFVDASLVRGIRLVAPRWNGTDYELAELKGCWPDNLVRGPHGILEPPDTAARVEAVQVDVWLVPGLAFTKSGARLGYGGGWYDRLLARANGRSRKIGVAYRFQLVEALPSERHDVWLDDIVTI